MAQILSPLLTLSPFSLSSSSSTRHFTIPSLPKLRFPSTSTSTCTCCRASTGNTQMEQEHNERPRFKDFPYASAPIRDLMMELASTVENRLDSQLLPCTLPQDVQYYQNQTGTAHASLNIRPGVPSSKIDMMLGSWLHCQLPTGGALNITSLSSFMNDSSDAPSLAIELIQSSPTSLVLVLDLPPRKDLVINSDYLKTFYEDSGLEKQRQMMYQIPEVQPYVSPSLFLRCATSPAAILVRIDTTQTGAETRLDEIVRNNVSVAAKEVLGIWFDLCVSGKRQDIGDDEKAYLRERDRMFKSKSIEIDLGNTLPNLFGQETADRVMGVLRSLLSGGSS